MGEQQEKPEAAAAVATNNSKSDLPSITKAELHQHTTTKSLWVTYQGRVFDITPFLYDHPGGEELLLQYGGQDIAAILGGRGMGSVVEHVHSDSAYDMLEAYCIGRLEGAGTLDLTEPEGKRVIGTASEAFLDTSKPMLPQMWAGTFSKAFYLEQVHIPRHVRGSAPIFASPWLEALTKTHWWVIPLFYAPVISYCLQVALQGLPALKVAASFVGGLALWTLIEYTLHRFLFHMERFLPDHPVALTLHFTLHGVHHFLPMDRLRLVMPPALGITLAWPIWTGITALAGRTLGNAIIAGSFFGFVMYDMTHYYIHHGRPFSAYLRELKSYHLDHHYKDPNLGYGITSKLWDYVFGTLL